MNRHVVDSLSDAISNSDVGFTDTVHRFEKQLSDLGLSSPVCVNSASSGLVIALKALKISAGDEVILPRQTFIATGLAVLEVGATPVFCDIDIKTGSLDLESVKKLLTKKTRAIVYVHWGGTGTNACEFLELAKRYRIGLIEDAAHAFGAEIEKGKKLGSIKDKDHFVVFSFQAIKFFSTGDGGCICSHPDHLSDLKALSWFGINRDEKQVRRKLSQETGLNVTLKGFKYNMNAIQASIGLANLRDLHHRIDLRRKRAKALYEAIQENNKLVSMINGVEELELGIFWFFPILCHSKHEFIDYLTSHNIPSSTIDFRIDVNPIFENHPKDQGVMQGEFDKKFLALSLCDHIPNDEITRFTEILRNY